MAKRRGGKQYIHADNWVVPMNFDKALMCVSIQEPTQWDIDKPDRVILTSDHPWDPASTNDTLEGIFIFPIDNEVDNNLYEYLHKINSADIHLDPDYSDSKLDDMVMCINNLGQ